MKTQNILLIAILMLFLVISSCREISIKTKVNTDGSFTRIITVTGEHDEVLNKDLPFPVDTSWEKKMSRDSTDSTKYIMQYTKFYSASKELNEEIKLDTNSYSFIEKNILVKQRFRFFFSYLTFEETYKAIRPFDLDYRDYLNENDIRFGLGYIKPESYLDSIAAKRAENLVENYFVAAAMEEIDSLMLTGIKKLDDPGLNSVDISVFHDSLHNVMEGLDFNKREDIIDLYSKWSGNNNFLKLHDIDPPLFEDYDERLDLWEKALELTGYDEIVEMPGLITATNSEMLRGNEVQWEFHAPLLFFRDTVFYAESRVVNYWAFILAGVVMLALIVVFVIRAFR